jgi:hypothetical protein
VPRHTAPRVRQAEADQRGGKIQDEQKQRGAPHAIDGTVNLSGRVSHIQVAVKMSQGSLLPNAADFRPDVKSLGPGSSVLSGSDMIAAEVEQVIDLIVGGEEALRLAGRFKLLHLPLSSACRLV